MDWDELDRAMQALTPEQIKARINAMLKERMKAEYARKQRERALQGYHEIKASDFN